MKYLFLLSGVWIGCATQVDPGRALQYPCQRDAGDPSQCPGDYVCGLEGYCHDPLVGFPYQCGANTDCTPDWRCGINGTCHDEDAGAPYACLTDLDCEQSWRCGPDGLCVDSRAEALRPGTPLGSLQATRISPLFEDLPDLFALSPPLEQQFGLFQGAVSWISDGGLTRIDYESTHGDHFGGVEPPSATVWMTPLVTPSANDVATVASASFVLDQGTVWQYIPNGPVPMTVSGLSTVNATSLRLIDNEANLLAIGSAQFAIGPVIGGSNTVFSVPDSGVLYDVIGVGPSPQMLIAATEAGAFFTLETDPLGWLPFNLGPFSNKACGGGGMPPARIYPSVGDNSLGPPQTITLETSGPDGRETWGSLAVALSTCDGGSPDSPNADCPVDGSPVFVWNIASDTATETLVRCRLSNLDGGPSEVLFLNEGHGRDDAGVGIDFVAEPDPIWPALAVLTQTSYVHPEVPAFADDNGGIHAIALDGGIRSVWLDQIPVALAGVASDPPAVRAIASDGTNQLFPLHQPGGLIVDQGTALADKFCLGIKGRPDWLLRGGNIDGGTPILAVQSVADFYASEAHGDILPRTNLIATLNGSEGIAVTACGSDQIASLHARTAQTSDGGVQLLVTGEDLLWAGDLTAFATWDGGDPAPSPVTLAIRTSPLPHENITSLTTLASTAGADLLNGYLLVQGRLFALRAETDLLWFTEEITLPSGDPAFVWADGPWGRVGYSDGTVYSLPSRVQIAPPLPENAPVVYDYAELCGQGYALGRNGLYRLDAQAGALGSWDRVTLEPAVRSGIDPGYSSGRLFSHAGQIWLFTRSGVVVAIRDSCP